jgi:uncharacterized protein YukE
MNPDEVEALGKELQNVAGQIQQICQRLNSQISQTTWMGRDSEQFKNQWWPEHQRKLQQAQQDLQGFGQSAINNAQEQRQVSDR